MIKARKSRLYKVISVVLAVLFLYQAEYLLSLETHSDLLTQFEEAKEAYLKGETDRTGYQAAKEILERLILCLDEKSETQKRLRGKVFLLLGASYENLKEFKKAKDNYKKAKNILKPGFKPKSKQSKGIIEKLKAENPIEEIDLNHLKLYQKYYMGKATKKFPVLLVVGGIVVVAVVLALVLKRKKKEYTLTVTRGEGVSGTPDTGTYTHEEGSSLNYNYNLQPGYTTLVVLLDGNEVSSSSSIEMSMNHTLTATATTNEVNFVTTSDELSVPEGGTISFQVQLSAQPTGDVSVTVSRASGDTDISIKSGTSINFTTENWQTPQTVELEAAEDTDMANGQAAILISANNANGIADKTITAKEQDNDFLRFVTDTESVTVPEGRTTSFNVKLSGQPVSDIQATVTRISGDSDITVKSGQNLTFTTLNWDTYQTVTLKAAKDDDNTNGEAIIRISAAGVTNKDITAAEDDRCSLFVSITYPANNATVSGAVVIQASVWGTCLVDLDRVEFLVDGDVIYEDTTAPYEASWDTLTSWEGTHKIGVAAYSTTGQKAEKEITVTVTR